MNGYTEVIGRFRGDEMEQFPTSEFDVDLMEREVLHKPSGITFSFYEYHSEDDWRRSDSVIYRDNPNWLGDRMALALAAKKAAIAKGMTAQKPIMADAQRR